MNNLQRGILFGLGLAADEHKKLAKSKAHFVSVDEWIGYKRGVSDYFHKIHELEQHFETSDQECSDE